MKKIGHCLCLGDLPTAYISRPVRDKGLRSLILDTADTSYDLILVLRPPSGVCTSILFIYFKKRYSSLLLHTHLKEDRIKNLRLRSFLRHLYACVYIYNVLYMCSVCRSGVMSSTC